MAHDHAVPNHGSGEQVGAMRQERRRWLELQAAKASLEEQVASWKSRFRAEAARADELAADVAKLSAALMAAESAADHMRQSAAQQQQYQQQPQMVCICSLAAGMPFIIKAF